MPSTANGARVYRISGTLKALSLILGLGVTSIALVMGWFSIFGSSRHPVDPVLIIAGILFGVLGYVLIGMTLAARVVLHSDTIEVRSLFGARRLRRDEVAGRRVIRNKNQSTLVLVPRRPGQKKLKISSAFKTDSVFREWLEPIPDLDAQDVAASEQAIAADPRLGRDPAERSRRLAQGKQVAKVLNGVASGVTMWGIIYPQPYGVVMVALAILPLIAFALVARFPGLYRLDQRRNDVHPNLVLVLVLPGVALFLRSMQDQHLLDWKPMLLTAMLAGVIVTWMATRIDASLRSRGWAVVGILLGMVVYAGGSLTLANAFLDRSAPQRYETSVIGKHCSNGRHRTWYLRLAAWGPVGKADDVAVPPALYESIVVGQHACVSLWLGALNFPWFQVGHCP